MFIIAGIGSLIVWYLRKNLPESPRWLEAQGRTAEAEALMQTIEKDVASIGRYAAGAEITAPTPQLTAASMFRPPILQRLLVGSWVLITINTLIFGFVIFLPQFFLRQGLTITNSLGYTVVLAAASLVGCAFGAYLVRFYRTPLEHYRRLHFHHRLRMDLRPLQRRVPIPIIVLSVGAVLIVAIYIQTCAAVRRVYAGAFSDRNPAACEWHLQYAWPRSHRRLAFRRRLPDGELRAARGDLADDRLVVMQIIAVYFWGVEPARRSLEGLDPKVA